MSRSASFALLAAATLSTGAAAQPQTKSVVDYARLADLAVNRTWKLAKGERVVFFWDKAFDRGMAAPLRAAVVKAGGIVDDIAAPTLESTKGLTPARRAKRDAEWAAIFAKVSAAIWLPSALEAMADVPFERLVQGSKVRSIHFHWFIPPDAGEVSEIEAIYAAAIAVPPATILGRITAVERAVRGATVRITAPNGTDLTFDIPRDAWVHRNTGDASPAKVASARSVRDREEELPASVFRTTDVRNAHGTIIGSNSFDTRSPTLKVTFAGGKVTTFESVKNAEAVVARWKAATGAKDRPGEFVVGTNPALPGILASGFMPYYGYGAGVVRLTIGDNWESSGTNRASTGEVLLFLANATVTAGGVTMVRDGRLVAGQ